ncbi:MAG: GNAT family N-acetyltransferase [Bacteroidota bacterium]|nr:GNAT family N-acetyltransferase [Bacteroidota bacterium]
MKLIREAVLGEISTIRDLAYSIWPSAYGTILPKQQLDYMLDKIYSLASLQTQFEEHFHSFILLFDNTVPAGFASFSEKENNGYGYHLHKIYVLPDQQGTGSGKMLLNYIINIAKTNNATSLTLNVNRHNKARYFYEKQGFTIKDKVDINIGNGYFMNDYIMELSF